MTDPFGNCRRCGHYVGTTSGHCDCTGVVVTWPLLRARVQSQLPVPSDWVRQLLEDYDRLRDR